MIMKIFFYLKEISFKNRVFIISIGLFINFVRKVLNLGLEICRNLFKVILCRFNIFFSICCIYNVLI